MQVTYTSIGSRSSLQFSIQLSTSRTSLSRTILANLRLCLTHPFNIRKSKCFSLCCKLICIPHRESNTKVTQIGNRQLAGQTQGSIESSCRSHHSYLLNSETVCLVSLVSNRLFIKDRETRYLFQIAKQVLRRRLDLEGTCKLKNHAIVI